MIKNPSLRNLVLIWLGWATVMVAFHRWVDLRVEPKRPDHVLFWTATGTSAGCLAGDRRWRSAARILCLVRARQLRMVPWLLEAVRAGPCGLLSPDEDPEEKRSCVS